MPIPSTVRPLPARNKRFGHFLVASTVSLIGSNVFDIAIPLYVLEQTGSVINLGLVAAALQLPHFLMAPLTGYFSDHNKKRQSLILADLGQVVLLLLLSVYAFSGATSLWPLFALVFLIKSLMLTFETISSFQLIPALVDSSDLTAANTWFLSLHRVIQIVGPLIGGVFLHFSGIQSCIWINILSFTATLHFSRTFKNMDQVLGIEKHSKPASLLGVPNRFQESIRFIWRSPVFRPFVLLMFLWNLSPMTLNSPSVTYYFTVVHHFTSAQYGLILSLIGVLGVIGFLISHLLYRHRPFGPVFYGSSVFQAVFGTLCLLPFGSPVAFALLYGLSRAGSSTLSMGTYFIRQTRVPRAQNGAINASLRMFFMAAAPLSSFLQGWIIDRFGVGISLFFGAVSLWGTWWYSGKLAKAYREEESFEVKYSQGQRPRQSA